MQEKLEKEHLRNEFDIWVGFGNWASWADYYMNTILIGKFKQEI